MKNQILKETLIGENMKGVQVANSQLNRQPKEKIIGTLTSRIEVKPSTDTPAYGFFRLDNYQQDIPVIFRIKCPGGNWGKPPIKKGSLVELAGYFINVGKERPSFTCFAYQLLQEPKPLTTTDLITLTSGLLQTTLEKYKEWTQRKDFLFKKLDELKEIEALSKLGHKFLNACLTLKWAYYSNFQEKYLDADFDLNKYLSNLSQEIQLVKSHIEAYQRKEIISHE